MIELYYWVRQFFPIKYSVYVESSEDLDSDVFKSLVHSGRIADIEYRMYMMFHLNANGRIWLNKKTDELSMAALPKEINLLLYLEGQRSIFKEINLAIKHVKHEIQKLSEEKHVRNPN